MQVVSVFGEEMNADAAAFCASMPAPPSGPEGTRRGAGMWRHAATGVLLPRGTVITTRPADDADRADVAAYVDTAIERRGVHAASQSARRIRRSAADTAALDAFCEWLHGHSLDLLATFTYSDEYAAGHGIYTLPAALDDVARGLRSVDMLGNRQGFAGKYVLAGEWHKDRSIPHVHGVLSSNGCTDVARLCRDLTEHFRSTRGRCRVEPMRDNSIATLYGLKDTMKASAADPDTLRMRLSRHRSYGHKAAS